MKLKKIKYCLVYSLQPSDLPSLEPEEAWVPLLAWGGVETAEQRTLSEILLKPLLSGFPDLDQGS